MKTIRINKTEFDKFRELQKKKRGDCHAAFSSNLSENPWPFVTFGLTPEQLREEVLERSPKLIQIVGIFVELRESTSGGRFFIDFDGVYWKDKDTNKQWFVEWKLDEPLQQSIKQLSRSELLAQIKLNKARKQAESHRTRLRRSIED
jgi:hypothetical protein